jgi:hypothetical protein
MDGMLAFWLTELLNPQFWVSSPFAWIAVLFQLWMLVDAIRREEWSWVVFIILFPVINAVLYFFLVYRASAPSGRGFELPGSADRRRIRELQGQIHHLDKAHHHAALGDIYFKQNKLDLACQSYRAALERDPNDPDIQAHLGRTLLGLGRPQEALPLLQPICRQNPKHDYGYSLMALAETYAALGEPQRARESWEQVAENYSYARARVELAQLHLAAGETQQAKSRLQEALADDAHAPEFERRQERAWIKRARKLLTSSNLG